MTDFYILSKPWHVGFWVRPRSGALIMMLTMLPFKDISPKKLISFFQISACTCPCSTESLWWRKLPPPAWTVVGSPLLPPLPPPPLHPLPPPLLHARRTRFTAGQKSSFSRSRTPSPRGRVLRCFLTYWRGGCCCGWCPMGCTQSACVRDECIGRDPWLHIWINPTSWRRSSRASCLTPSNSLLVSRNMRLVVICSHLHLWTDGQ